MMSIMLTSCEEVDQTKVSWSSKVSKKVESNDVNEPRRTVEDSLVYLHSNYMTEDLNALIDSLVAQDTSMSFLEGMRLN